MDTFSLLSKKYPRGKVKQVGGTCRRHTGTCVTFSTLLVWLPGRGISFFRCSSVVFGVHPEQVCVYTDRALSSGREMGIRQQLLGMRVPLAGTASELCCSVPSTERSAVQLPEEKKPIVK